MSSFDDLTHNLTPFSSTQSLTAVNIQRLIQLLSTTVALGMLLLLTALPASGQVQVLDQVVAIVDDDIILASELQERVQGVRSTMEARGVEVPEDEILVRETLDRLILDSIQLQLANRYGVRIPDQQLDESMTRLAKQNGLTLEQFKLALEQSGQSYAAAREGLRDDLAIQRVQQGNVMRNINISEQEIDNFLDTEEGEAMTQPEYRVIQALLATRRGEAADEIDAKENYVDAVLANIQAGTAFEKAVAGIEPYAFSGGDLGWRKLGDIPSMFADVVPTLSIGDVTKVRSSSGFHLVYLADAVGGERLVKQTDVRHILIKPNEVLDDAAAQRLASDLVERIRGGEDFGSLARQYSDDIGSAAEGGELLGPTRGRWSPNLKRPWPAPPRVRLPSPFAASSVGTFSRSRGVAIRISREKYSATKLPTTFASKNIKKSSMPGSEKFARKRLSTSSKRSPPLT